jgi:Tn3 transposase DDE domain
MGAGGTELLRPDGTNSLRPLHLVIAAIVYWNTTYIADAVAHLRASKGIDDGLLAHTSPLTWEHISFSGDFLWERAAAAAGNRRPLNLGRVRQAA